MPQLDTLSWFNQSLSICFSFWFLFFTYYLLVLIEDSRVMKFNFKVTSLREIFNVLYAKQKAYLHTEIFLIWFINLIAFFNLQKSTTTRQNVDQSVYLGKFAPALTKINGQLHVKICTLH